MTAIFADSRYRPGMGFLSDRRRMRLPFSRLGLERVIQFLAAHAKDVAGSSWAAMTTGTGPVHESIEIVAKLSQPSGVHIRPFTELDQGLDWVSPQSGPKERHSYLEWLETNAVG